MTTTTISFLWSLGCVLGASGVAFGAVGAHLVRKRVPPNLASSWETAAHYQLIHAVPIMIASQSPNLHIPAGIMAAGTVIFSGSIYGLVAVSRWRWLGPLTPLGGLLMIAGWTGMLFNGIKG